MVFGTFLGLLVGILLGMRAWFFIKAVVDYKYSLWLSCIAGIVICIAVSICGGFIGIGSDVAEVESFINQYEATHMLYEASIEDERLSGLERLEIVQMANRTNMSIADRKAKIDKWWNFAIPEELKDKIRHMEYVK